MKAVDYPLVGSYNNQRVESIDAERSVNCFEYLDNLAKKRNILIGTSGLENTGLEFVGNTTNGFRAQYFYRGNMYAVVGSGFYKIIEADIGGVNVLTAELISNTIGSTIGYVGIDANTFQIIIVDGAHGYIYDTNASTFQQITDPNFPATPIDVCTLDNFFVVAVGNTNTFQLSLLDQGLIWGLSNDTFTMAGTSSHIVLTQGDTSVYPVGMNVSFAGGSIPAEFSLNTTYYVVQVINSTTFTVSATAGGTPITSSAGGHGNVSNIGQLQLGAITSHPGNIVACKTLHRRLFLFSQFFTEVWENQGIGTSLPFRRNNSFLIEYGTPAVGSVSVGFDMMFFLSQDRDGLGSVMQVNGVEAIPVSNRALDFQFAQYAQIVTNPPGGGVSDARGFLVKENGLIFYRLNFTTANSTYVYNVTMSDPSTEETRRWHEEQVLNGNRHPAQTHAFFNGSNYYGHYSTGILYYVDVSLTTNDGEAMHRFRIGKPVCPPGYQRLRIDRFQIDLLQGQVVSNNIYTNQNIDTELGVDILTEAGINLITEQGFVTGNLPLGPPELFFSYSKDGGQTYGTIFTLPMGNVGQRTFRTLIRKLGTTVRGQAFVPRIDYYSIQPFCVLGASWAFEELPE